MSEGLTSRLRVYLRLAAGALLLAFIAWRVHLGQLTVRSWPLLLSAAAGAVVLLLVAQALSAVRWRAVLGSHEVTWVHLWRLFLIGQFFGLFLPSLVGGDAVRAIALTREIRDASRSVTSIIVDRLLGLLAMGIYLLFGLLLVPVGTIPRLRLSGPHPSTRTVVLGAIVVTIVAVGVGIALRSSERIRAAIGGKLRVLRMIRQPPRVIARWVALSLLVQGTYIVIWWTLDVGMQLGVSVRYLLFAVPLVNVVAMLPITFSGIGVREGAWVVLLAPLGVAGADAVAFSVLYFVCYTIVGGVGGVLFVWYGTSARRGTDGVAGDAGSTASSGPSALPSISFPPPSRVSRAE